MEVDRDLRTQAQDEPVGDACLRLGQRARAGVLLIARPSRRKPAVGEVAIEVDPVCVLARVCRGPIGVEIVDDPQVDALWSARRLQAPRH